MDNLGDIILRLVKNNPAANIAIELLSPFGEVYIVGGAIRDVLLEKMPKDLDVVAKVDENTIKSVLGDFPNSKLNKTGKQFPVYRFSYQGEEVEIALPRTETKVGEGNKDWEIKSDPSISIERDLERRDFTANAIAVNAKTGEVIDPLNGVEDVQRGLLRVISDNSFKDDSSRTLRALTAISKHGLQPDEDTKSKMRNHAPYLSNVSPEIIGAELEKILSGSHPHDAIEMAYKTGVLEHFIPELHGTFEFDQKNPHHKYDLGTHLLTALKNMSHRSGDVDLRIAALFHDIGKPDAMWVDENGVGHYYRNDKGEGKDHENVGAEMAEDILRRLRFSANRIARIKQLIQNHMFAPFNSPKGARKFLNQAGSHEVAHNLLDLKESDHMSKGNEDATRMTIDSMRELINSEHEAQNAFGPKDLALKGNEIMDLLGIDSGPQVGQIIKHLTDVVMDSPEMNTKQNLSTFLRNFYKTSSYVKTAIMEIHKEIRKEAAWRDVEMKAKRLKDSGQVVVNTNSENVVEGTVQGDTGIYEAVIYRQDPNANRITHWNCDCKWGQYAWGRTRQFAKFEGRPCSHVMALLWQSRSLPIGYFGAEFDPSQTYSFEPDAPNYEVAQQDISQVGNLPEQQPDFAPAPNSGVPLPPPFGEQRNSSNKKVNKWKRIGNGK
jgi:tRNA nucleotidyltransferase (CCA-adding enzyme)